MTKLGQVTFTATTADGSDLAVTCGLGDGSPTVLFTPGWQVVQRNRAAGFTHWQGRDPLRLTIPVILNRMHEGSQGRTVEPEIRVLERMAGLDKGAPVPPPLTFDSAGLVPHDVTHAGDVKWVIETLDQSGEAWRNHAGHRVRQAITVGLLQYVAPDPLKLSAAKRHRHAKRDTKPREHRRTYRVKAGDTLSSIAARQLGSYKRWPEIRDLNHLHGDHITVNQTLRLP